MAGSKNLVTKLIDFSDSFFENDPPETIMSKDFWWSPEVALYSKAAASGVSPNPYKNIFLVRLTYSHWELYSISIVRRVASHLSARKHSLGKSLIQERLHRLLQKLNQSSEP